MLALIGYMLYLNWKLTRVFAITPAIAGVVVAVGRHFRRYSRRIQDSMGEVTQLSNESMQAFDEIRMFSATDTKRTISGGEPIQPGAEPEAGVCAGGVDTDRAGAVGTGAGGAVLVRIGPRDSRRVFCWLFGGVYCRGDPVGQTHSHAHQQSIIQRGLAAAEDLFAQIDAEPEPVTGSWPRARPWRHCAGAGELHVSGAEDRCSRISALRSRWENGGVCRALRCRQK